MSYVILALYFLSGVALGGIGSQVLTHDSCAELVAIEKARDAKVQEQEQKMKDFFTSKPVPRPQWNNPGLMPRR